MLDPQKRHQIQSSIYAGRENNNPFGLEESSGRDILVELTESDLESGTGMLLDFASTCLH